MEYHNLPHLVCGPESKPWLLQLVFTEGNEEKQVDHLLYSFTGVESLGYETGWITCEVKVKVNVTLEQAIRSRDTPDGRC